MQCLLSICRNKRQYLLSVVHTVPKYFEPPLSTKSFANKRESLGVDTTSVLMRSWELSPVKFESRRRADVFVIWLVRSRRGGFYFRLGFSFGLTCCRCLARPRRDRFGHDFGFPVIFISFHPICLFLQYSMQYYKITVMQLQR